MGITVAEARHMRNNIDIEGTITDKKDRRTVNLRAGGTAQVCDMMLEDHTGDKIKLSLWGDDIDQVKDGDAVKISSAYTNTFRGEIGLSIGRNGKLEVNPQ